MPAPFQNEIWCRKCDHFETLSRAARSGETCPLCNGPVLRRKGPPPSPLSHAPQVLRAILGVRGIFYMVAVAFFAATMHWTLWMASLVMITLASLKLALRAMSVTSREPLEFPQVSPEELFDRSSLWPAGVFTLFFLVAPSVLFSVGGLRVGGDREGGGVLDLPGMDAASLEKMQANMQANMQAQLNGPVPGGAGVPGVAARRGPPAAPEVTDTDTGLDSSLESALDQAQRQMDQAKQAMAKPQPKVKPVHKRPPLVPGYLLLGALLLLYAPMALSQYLGTGSTLGIVFLPQGIAAIRADPNAYLGLCAVALPAFGGALLVDALSSSWPFYLSPLGLIPRNAMILIGWAACGLYVRQRARAFGIHTDDDDWTSASAGAEPALPRAPAR